MPEAMGFECDRTEIEEVEKMLREYVEKEREIDNQELRLQTLESKWISVSSPTFSDMPKPSSPNFDRNADRLYQLEKLREELREATREQAQRREYIESLIVRLHLADERAVIRMRYIDGITLNDVLFMIFGDKEDFMAREDTYRRRIQKLKLSAFRQMAVMISSDEVPT